MKVEEALKSTLTAALLLGACGEAWAEPTHVRLCVDGLCNTAPAIDLATVEHRGVRCKADQVGVACELGRGLSAASFQGLPAELSLNVDGRSVVVAADWVSR